ncbi:MAG: hypothetical protein PEPC_01762 [Peptostreptococcus russellii]
MTQTESIFKTIILLQHLAELHKTDDIDIYYIDLFCGAGGTSTGVELATINGKRVAKVIVCVNHDANAIASHMANHPYALHFTEDMRTLDLRPIVNIVKKIRISNPNAKIVLWASLECTNFSRAKGGQSRDADSRTLAEHLFRYIEAIDPDYIQIENVVEFMTWGPLIVKTSKSKEGFEYCPCNIEKVKTPTKRGEKKKFKWNLSAQMIPEPSTKGIYYNRWVEKVKGFGYSFEKKTLNSADFGARTSRVRFFGIFAKGNSPIAWPSPTHSKEGSAELFDKREKWRPVKDVLDLEDEGESIFDRNTPLSPNTYTRHKSGLIKFVCGGKDKYMIKWNSMNQNGKYQAPGVDDPCPVVSCQNRLGLAQVNYLSKQFSGHPDSKNVSLEGPAGTITTIDHHALIQTNFFSKYYSGTPSPSPSSIHADFLAAYYGSGENVRSIEMPCATVTTKDRFNYVSPKFLFSYNFKDAGKSLLQPSPTLLTKDRLAMISCKYFNNYYSGGGQHANVNQPSPTLLANPKQRLVSCNFIDMQYGCSRCVSVDQPAGTLVKNPKHSLITCNQWLMNTSFSNIGSSLHDPAPVVTANRKWHYLVNPQFDSAGGSIESPCFTLIARMDKKPPMITTCQTVRGEKVPSFVKFTQYGIIYEIYEDDLPVIKEIKEIMAMYWIIDIKQRMLKIPELKQIMGFSESYVLIGSQAEQKKYIGNAVEVNTARVLCEALATKILHLKQAA